jgi:hypothetical protein
MNKTVSVNRSNLTCTMKWIMIGRIITSSSITSIFIYIDIYVFIYMSICIYIYLYVHIYIYIYLFELWHHYHERSRVTRTYMRLSRQRIWGSLQYNHSRIDQLQYQFVDRCLYEQQIHMHILLYLILLGMDSDLSTTTTTVSTIVAAVTFNSFSRRVLIMHYIHAYIFV